MHKGLSIKYVPNKYEYKYITFYINTKIIFLFWLNSVAAVWIIYPIQYNK